MKTRFVTFTNGTVKNASLEIPAEDFSVMDVVDMIRKSYLAYAFRPGCGLMSDEVLTTSIGQANFFEGALGGYQTRVSEKTFDLIRDTLNCDLAQAFAVAAYREPNATASDHWLRASQNKVLSAETRALCAERAAMLKNAA